MIGTTSDHDDDITQVQIGEAFRLKVLEFPTDLLSDKYTGYYMLTQSKRNSSIMEFEKAGATGEEAVKKLKEVAGKDSDQRGIIMKGPKEGIYVNSPKEPNPDNDPQLVDYNPQLEMIGEFLQSKNFFDEDVSDEKEAGIEVECESEEKNEEWIERITTFISGIMKRYTGSKCKFTKKE